LPDTARAEHHDEQHARPRLRQAEAASQSHKGIHPQFKPIDNPARRLPTPGQGKRGSVFRFLDLEFAPETVASAAFELPGEGMEGYAVLTKQEGAWRVVGIHVNEP
jgi:hypothetical protein